ncbi:PE-PPE domain-containing protein [Nocardia farcinica]|uniref:PE-PPE domain-containing protein n=1 Tax=Nocardia farcinica TaxID=37329 RepID=UPI0024577F3A|nr:PE-PPE domain-containing protein [Nocardia farcinica]
MSDQIDVLWLGGTGFPRGGDGVSETFGRALDRDRFRFRIVPYPATFGGHQPSWAESRKDGRIALLRAMRDTENRVVLGGYSQGAGIAGGLAAQIASGPLETPRRQLIACALIADPERPRGAGMPGRPAAPGYGIVGERPVHGLPAFWAAAERDPITALPAGSPLRTLPDVLDYYSMRSPAAARAWGEALVQRARQNRFQRWWDLRLALEWGGAVRQALDYLPSPPGGGRHGQAYVIEGLATALAHVINEEVR